MRAEWGSSVVFVFLGVRRGSAGDLDALEGPRRTLSLTSRGRGGVSAMTHEHRGTPDFQYGFGGMCVIEGLSIDLIATP